MCDRVCPPYVAKEEEIVLRFTKTEALALRELLRSARSLQWKLRDALEPPQVAQYVPWAIVDAMAAARNWSA